ncbi:MAG: beta-ketoacyl synthase N-terminal-like domain-containing protein [Patescibacteria group bacterium]|nr:beta-ketoacyl synthase N-terminal-like domain-containing protein [Patescibacteria group bacterium]
MNRRRVVITGMGTISPIGNNIHEVKDSLFTGKSGIDFNPMYAEKGLTSQISGQLPDAIELINAKKISRFMSMGAGYSYLSMKQALEDSGLPFQILHSSQTGLIIGTGGGSPAMCIELAHKLDSKGLRSVLPTYTAKCMVSSAVANLSVLFGIHGATFSINSACASSTHAIGEAFDKIANGRLNTTFVGGCDEHEAYIAASFDRAQALSRHNDNPQTASRPYDTNRDGFVMSGGGGILVLEEMSQAVDRGAKIYAEIIGYGTSSDGYHMTIPSGEGALHSMQQAINDCPGEMSLIDIDYINTHGTSTPAGDIVELESIRKVFGSNIPYISSTKSLTGHALGAAGVHEIIYSIIMMENDFIAASANITDIDPVAATFPIVQKRIDTSVNVVMSNSFGFGGTNATLIIKKFDA